MAAGLWRPASGSDGGDDDIVKEAPPHHLLHKPCEEAMPWAKKYHKWSWTKERQGARVEFRSGDWQHKWLAHELCRHVLVNAVEPQRNKLKNSKKPTMKATPTTTVG